MTPNYEAVANVLNAAIVMASTDEAAYAARTIARALADIFTTDDPDFDRARFFAACTKETA